MSNNNDRPVTRGMLNEAAETILEGIDRLLKKKLDETKNEHRQEFRRVEVTMKDEINGIKGELSNTATHKDITDLRQEMRKGFKQTVTREEFNDLKRKVDRYHPIN